MNDNKDRERLRKRAYRKTHKAYTLHLPNEDARKLEDRARKKEMNVSQFLKALIRADELNVGYVLPNNTKIVELIATLRKTGGNINQLVRHCHTESHVTYNDIDKLTAQVKSLEAEITKALARPDSIETIIRHFIAHYPERYEQLLHFIQIINDYKTDPRQTLEGGKKYR